MPFLNEKNEIAAIDPQKLEIIGRYPVPGVKEPHGIALDVANRLAFVAGAGNHTLAVVDLASMKTLGTYPQRRKSWAPHAEGRVADG